ncbi:vacuolar protein sorting-associated protein 13D-like [Amphibalanus amphitrite]|uniref:vacuolar protein sorting-associated protein 13D-like n=1 Tax=Amphibalanus amphitrite TaxID=1232801 RepID=UPI001C91E145|nr:vacuolar protein sorting-associated protein 13D-like [Amphibalanus amphitrite]
MLESLAAWVLNNYLGQYLENLNTDQLSVGLLQGAVEMENVPLRKDALSSLDLPVRVTAGFVGKIRLSIPVRRLSSEPWSISIEQLYVVLGPVRPEEMDADAEEAAARQRQLWQLDAVEATWRAEHEAKQETSYYAASYSSWVNYGSSIVGNIVANLQLKIRDVHVRYEEPGFAVGLTVGALTAQSCDERWVPGFVAECRDNMRFKLLDLQQLDVYWDTQAQMYSDMTIGQLAEVMIAGAHHEFLLSPVTVQARLKRDCSERPLRSRARPRHVLDLQCERLSLSLADKQFQQAVGWARSMEVLDRRRRCLRHRADRPPREAPAAWWRFAILTHLDRIGRRRRHCTWEAACERAALVVRYAAVYREHLRCPATLTAEQRALKLRCESEFEFEALAALREWCMLQEEREAALRREQGAAAAGASGSGRGLLQSWFPAWGGWYGGAGEEPERQRPELEAALDQMADTLENSSALKRDAVFGQLNFSLKQAEMKLVRAEAGGERRPLFDLAFEKVEVAAESRPRSGSHLLQTSLGALYLHDHATAGSAFPRLVAPQPRAAPAAPLRQLSRLPGLSSLLAPAAEPPLFELHYERRPPGSRADYKLHVTSRSLDVVYNPEALRLMRQFFTARRSDADAERLARLENAARVRYESLKRQTREELMQTWEQMVEGDNIARKTWDVMFNISAPHIILPETLQDPSGLLLVLDFGHLKLHNDMFWEEEARRQAAAAAAGLDDDDADDEDFCTPCSTPQETELESGATAGSAVPESPSTDTISMATAPEMSPAQAARCELQKKMYDKFSLNFSDLQVLVGRVRDNWRQALAKGSSPMHVLDRFTISLQLERRRLAAADPEWPLVHINGNLSHLMVHVSEQKVHALRTLASRLLLDEEEPVDSPTADEDDLSEMSGEEDGAGGDHSQPAEDEDGGAGPSEPASDSARLLVVQFATGQMSLAVQSRGRAVAELQVCGARGQLTRRRRRLQLALSVHSLLLVDALQTYGADFEILVASHRGVGVDSVSGSLLDSEPCSPCSPASPTGVDRSTSPVSLTQAVNQKLQSTSLRVVSPDPGGGGADPPQPTAAAAPAAGAAPEPGLSHTHDALITLDVTIVLPTPGQTPSQTLRTVSMRFNTLDVIANQETIVELAGFLNRISTPPDPVSAGKPLLRPAESDGRAASPLGDWLSGGASSPPPPAEPETENSSSSRTELTFDFHKLNVLLLRSVSDRFGLTGRKVATATVSGARIQATLSDQLAVSGALGGLQVRELSPAAHRHPCVLSVGFDPVVEQSQDLLRRLNADLYRDSEQCPRALQFTARRPAGAEGAAQLEVRLASVCYTHSAPFLVELGGCVDEFKQYVTELARSVGAAAAEMAREMVHIRSDSVSDAGSLVTGSDAARSTLSPPPAAGRGEPSPQPAAGQSLAGIELSVVLETPIVVVPESAGSSRVLVAHLGRIALNCRPEDKHRLHVTDMNLYSLDLDKVMLTKSLSPGRAFSTLRADQLYDARLCGDPILYDTALEVTLQSVEVPPPGQTGTAAGRAQQTLQVDGQFVTPVRLSVLKSQYEQIMRTMNNLTVPSAAGAGDVETETTQEDDVTAEEPGKEPLERKISAPAQSHGIPIHGSFQLSEFEMELRSDMSRGGPCGLVTLTFSDLSVAYERRQPDLTELSVTLQGVTMEDLLQLPDAPHRYLLHSHNTVSERRPSAVGPFLSASCPDIAAGLSCDDDLSLSAPTSAEVLCGSLPDRLNGGGFLAPRPAAPRSTYDRGARSTGCRSPPSSPTRPAPDPEKALIQCTVTLRSGARAAAVSRTVDLNFNCLDVVVSPQSWVMVLDFFNGQPHPPTAPAPESGVPRSSSRAAPLSAAAAGGAVTETLVRVRSLSLLLNQPGSGPLARATVTDYSSRTLSGTERATTSGRLGALAMVDLTSHGALYKERFVTAGPEAVHFDFVKFQSPDPSLRREFDTQLRLRMASVQYVHTARFLAELQQFFAHFTELQDLLNRLQSEEEVSSRGSRVSLDVQAGSPVLLLPLSATSRQLLVADLGRLRVTNAFRLSGSEPPDAATARDIPFSRRAAPRGRVSPVLRAGRVDRPATPDPVPCLLDVMEVSLSDMDVYSAERLDVLSAAAERPGPSDLHLHSYLVRPTPGGRVLKRKAGLKLVVERNLDAALNHDVPDMSVRGSLSTLDLSVDLPQYKLVRGLLVHNLGEPLGMEPTDLIQPHHVPVLAPETVWLTMSVRLDLQNVSLELVTDDAAALARVDFIRSQLLFESFSDSSKDVDLMSREIRLHDTRFTDFPANKRSNVFSLILQPLFAKTERSLQAELHYRASAEHAQFTVLLNSMRLMGVLDWWREVNEFINASPDGASPPEDPSAPSTVVPANPSAAPTAGMAVGAGVVTRRAAVLGQPQQSLELKLNVSDCELVLVENPTLSDSAAVILKTTACVQYRPQSREKPLSCELQNCELFSCLLGGAEQETALSIVDPATVNIEIAGKQPPDAARGILDATDTEVHFHMEVLMQQLNVRVSYHDMKMFVAIMESLPKQTGAVAQTGDRLSAQPVNLQAPLRQLQRLGFAEEDCERALAACQGRLDDAAIWLTQHASPTTEAAPPDPPPSQPLFDLRKINLHTSSFSMCVIDDCGDADVPLVELCMNHLLVSHSRDGAGEATCELSCDYYNRALSGWEPCIEPFKCELDWRRESTAAAASSGGTSPSPTSNDRLTVNIRSKHQANVNVTTTLLELYSMVRTNWTEDYYNRHRLGGPRVASRRRSPFVPFSLKNDTGSRLKFRTVLTSFSGGQDAAAAGPAGGPGGWTEVGVDEAVPFTFGGRGKLRHQDTHTTRQHQLVVWVEGWQPASPVSVDRVGVYFRQTAPVPGRHPSGMEQPPARVVFAVTLQGTARKLVTVRSALMVANRLPDPVEIKMEGAVPRIGGPERVLQVSPGARRPVPLALVHCQQLGRPLSAAGGGWSLTAQPWRWWAGESGRRRCRSWQNAADVYRFCVNIERDSYPEDPAPYTRQVATGRLGVGQQPGHTITLLPPVTIVNLLPCELRYSVSCGASSADPPPEATRRIDAGKQAALVDVDLEQELLLSLSVEGCRPDRALDITAARVAGLDWAPVALRDSRGRLLQLRARLRHGAAGWLRLSVSAPYWLVNRTGLPLVVAQEQTEQTEAAGQEADHERARSVAPLMFSLSDPEAPHMMVARLGRGQHPDGLPRWCHHFHLQPGLSFRRLRVSPRDTRRPDIVYVVGIETRPGRGRYGDTHIITVSPRFQVDNRSSHRLLLSQLHFAESFVNPAAQQQWVLAVPDSQMAFHWPRHDCDHLLCVKLADVADCHWSGGFLIDRTDSFHINVRDKDGLSRFLRVEVVLQSATYYVVFMDADAMPPPFRVDNFSEVNITYYQSGTQEHYRRSAVRPRCSAPYAWDMPPCQPQSRPTLTVVAPGGQADTFDLNQLNQRKTLHYDNFMFIAFSGTFGGPSGAAFDPQNVECRQLVLDVADGVVVLRRKEPGVRSQLWRHLPTGHLVHEGSSPPRDLRHPESTDRLMVLDIATPGIQPYECVPLRLRRLDARRQFTQRWQFTADGRLCCQHPNLFVQAQDGFSGLCRGKHAVLGPVSILPPGSPIPPEQAVQPQMQWPGSGELTVRVVTDGPTRVLQVTDAKPTGKPTFARLDRDWLVVGESSGSRLVAAAGSTEERPAAGQTELTVKLHLPAGVGVSLVSATPPAELLYLYLGDIAAECRRTASRLSLDGSVRHVQADCQLIDTQAPCVLHVTPGVATDDRRHLPAVCFAVQSVPSACERWRILEHLVVSVKDLTLTLEERLLYHLLHFIGYKDDASEVNQLEESDHETQRALKAATSSQNTRYYCRLLQLALKKVRLSVLTSARLRPELAAVRAKFGRRLVQFEGAHVELDPFVRHHPFETAAKLTDSVLEHYKEELKSQAAIILGSTDFLGNPLGLLSDVTEGVSGLVREGDVGALVKNVTHGVANSTAKVTGSLSDAVGWVTMDEKHDDSRRRILDNPGTDDHLMTGLRGFGLGLWGGASSLVVQPIQGASAEGVWGFFSGIGKGLVGTVTKPAVGFLDLATGAAKAVKDTSSGSDRQAPPRVRPIRVVQGAGGLLPRFSGRDADGQELLNTVTDRHPDERFVAYEVLCPGEQRATPTSDRDTLYPELLSYGRGDLRVLISTEMVRVLSHSSPGAYTLNYTVHFSELDECRPSIERDPYGTHIYKVVLTVSGGGGSGRKPAFVCQNNNVAFKITELINFGKSCYEELKHTVPISEAPAPYE